MNPTTDPADDPRRRGTLVLADRVIEKIAAQVAGEVGGATGDRGGLFGLGHRADPHRRPSVGVHLTPEYADLTVEVGVRYPQSIRQVTEQVRHQVKDRVERLAGVPVRRVDVTVDWLHYDPPPVAVLAQPTAIPDPPPAGRSVDRPTVTEGG